MTTDPTVELAATIRRHREALLADWRSQVRCRASVRAIDFPTLDGQALRLIDRLAEALETGESQPAARRLSSETSPLHGEQHLWRGYDIEELVVELNILRGCVHRMAEDHGQRLQDEAFSILNQRFNALVAESVRTYTAESESTLRKEQDRLLAFVAHDLRTPLNAISIALDLLDRKKADRVLRERMMASLRRNVQRLKSLVNEVLAANMSDDASPGERPQLRSANLRQLVQGCLNELEPVTRDNGATVVNAVPEALMVRADPVQMARILQNLVGNALSHAHSGQIVVGAEPATGGRLSCFVHDDGVGLSQGQTVPAQRRGDDGRDGPHGLGLAIVKNLVEAHGGRLHVDSDAPRGTTFRFDVQLASDREMAE